MGGERQRFANLLGSKGLFLSSGARTFAHLGLQGDAGTHFRLRFSYNTLTVDSNEFNVKPNHVFVSVHPSDEQYGSGATKADIGSGITVQARDGNSNVMTRADNTNAGTDTAFYGPLGLVTTLNTTNPDRSVRLRT